MPASWSDVPVWRCLGIFFVGFISLYSIAVATYSMNQYFRVLVRSQSSYDTSVPLLDSRPPSSSTTTRPSDAAFVTTWATKFPASPQELSSSTATSLETQRPTTTTSSSSVATTLLSDELGVQESPSSTDANRTAAPAVVDVDVDVDNSRVMLFQQKRKDQGFGSMTVNSLMYGMYFEEAHNRTFYMNEVDIENYQWNSTFHLYEGFFEHTFPIIRGGADQFFDNGAKKKKKNVTKCDMLDWKKNKPAYRDGCNILLTDMGEEQMQYRDYLIKTVKESHFRGNDGIYEPLSKYICKKLPRLSRRAQLEVDALMAKGRSFPPKFDVAYHIRRTDKISESPLYTAKKYLDTYQQNVNPSSGAAVTAKHCFLATDDYAVVNEFKEAMKQTNTTCQLWTMTEANYRTTRGREDFILFLAQQQIMVKAEYFVGMFTSNVGNIVSLFRACPTWANHSDSTHYYRSYGVEEGTIRQSSFQGILYGSGLLPSASARY